MEDTKIISNLILMIGLGLAAYGGWKGDLVIGAIGTFVILVSRFVDEYWDDWFGV